MAHSKPRHQLGSSSQNKMLYCYGYKARRVEDLARKIRGLVVARIFGKISKGHVRMKPGYHDLGVYAFRGGRAIWYGGRNKTISKQSILQFLDKVGKGRYLVSQNVCGPNCFRLVID